MRTRANVLELAILGQLQDSPMHGYELRKRLNATLGAVRALSYGSLYPALRALVERGWIEPADRAELPHALAGKRARIVYRLTANGKEHLGQTLNRVDPGAWEDETFDVHFSLFADVEPGVRLRILEGRRIRILERREAMRAHLARARERRDAYTLELQRHGLDQIDREVRWLEDLITAERDHPPAADDHPLTPYKPPPAANPTQGETT